MRKQVQPPQAPHTEESIRAWLVQLVARQARVTEHEVAPDLTFEELGFDSRTAVSMSGTLEKAFGLRLAPGLLFDQPTVAGLARYLAGELAAGADPAP